VAVTIRAARQPGLLPWTARNAHRGWVKASPGAASDQFTAAGSGAASPASEPRNMPMTSRDAIPRRVQFGS
jgi:hypothetical protein